MITHLSKDSEKCQLDSINFAKLSLYQPIQLRHLTCLNTVNDIDVRFHGLVVGVAGPFHHDVGRDAEGEGVYDEGAAAGVGADELMLGVDFIGADVPFISRDSDFFINAGEFAKLLDVPVHGLVGIVRQRLVILEGGVLVFLQNCLRDIVQFDGDTVCRLYRRDLDMVTFDVAATQVVDVGMPQAGEAAEKENVPDRVKVGLRLRKLQIPDTGQFVLGQVDDLLLRHLEGRAEGLVGKVGIIALVCCPVQEPAEIAEFLLNGGILEPHQVFLIIVLSFSFLLAGSAELLAVAHIGYEFC